MLLPNVTTNADAMMNGGDNDIDGGCDGDYDGD